MIQYLIPLGLYLGFNYWDRKRLLKNVSDENVELTKPIKTSIVLCAYNEENYISKALNSIFSQNIIRTYPEYFEVIVVDNASTDNTFEIASQYPIKVIRELRKGKLYARDVGIKEANGDIVIPIDADGYYLPNYVNILLSIFNEYENIVGICGIFALDKFGSLVRSKSYSVEMPYMFGAASAFKKKYYEGFNLSINQFSLKDLAKEEEENFAIRLSKHGDVVKSYDAVAIVSDRRYTPFFTDTNFRDEVNNKQRFGKLILGV